MAQSRKLSPRRVQRPHVLKTAALAWSLWRWLPPSQRRSLYHLLRRHGPAILSREVSRRKKRR